MICLLLSGIAAHTIAVTELRCVGTEFTSLTESTPQGPRGLAITLLNELGDKSGFHCNVELLPWKRAQAMVAHNEADILIGPYRTRARLLDMYYLSRPFYLDRALFFALKQTPQLWNGQLSALKGQSIAIVRGWSLGDHFDAFRAMLSLVEVDSTDQALRLLLTGRISLLAGNERNFAPLISRPPYASAVIPLDPPIQFSAGYFAMSGKWRGTALASQFDRAMNDAINSGRVRELSLANGLDFPGPKFDWAAYVEHELGN